MKIRDNIYINKIIGIPFYMDESEFIFRERVKNKITDTFENVWGCRILLRSCGRINGDHIEIDEERFKLRVMKIIMGDDNKGNLIRLMSEDKLLYIVTINREVSMYILGGICDNIYDRIEYMNMENLISFEEMIIKELLE